MYDFSAPVAEVSQHPTNPDVRGLKNLAGEKWTSTAADGTVREVEPGRSVALGVGTRINFGSAEDEIRL
jgi:eukaryotic-like serine/threonine-protein kinase